MSAAGPAAAAVAAGLSAPQKAVDDARCTPDTRPYRDGIFGAVLFTGAALHAEIPVDDHRFAVLNTEYIMRTNDGAHHAAVALFGIQLQGDHIFEVG